MNINLAVKATINPDGSVACALDCDGQQATVTFTGTEVLLAIPDPVQESA